MRQQTLCAMIFLFLLILGVPAWSATVVHGVRIGLHPTHTRLVLDCQGDRSLRVERQSPQEWVVTFDSIETPQGKNRLSPQPRGRIQKLQWVSKGSSAFLKVFLKAPHTEAKIFTLEDSLRPPDGYRLVIDFGLPGVSSWAWEQNKTSQPQEALKTEKAEGPLPILESSSTAQNGASIARTSSSAAPASSSPQPITGAPSARITRPIEPQSLYDMADLVYEELRSGLPQTAEEIVAAYQRALHTDPQNPRRASALLRLAQTLDGAGDVKKSERFYQRIIDEHPQDYAAALAWLRLGEIQASRGNVLEALKAYHEAERFSLTTPELLRVRWGLAQVYLQSGKAAEALNLLKRLLEEQPEAYMEKPEIYRTLGEAAFAQKEWAASRSYLMHYINLVSDIPDKDIVLARIAESYLYEGNRTQAEKLYAYIQVHYPDSEGDLIGRLRKAEYYETQGPELQQEAFKIYKDLELQQISAPLKHFVQFKLAYGDFVEGRHEKSLERINAVLKPAEKAPVYDDLRVLRRKVLQALVKKRFEAADAKGVLSLYAEDPFAFQEGEGLEALACVAEAYESLGFYAEAMALYENLVHKDPKPKWQLAVARMAYEMENLEKAQTLCLALSDPSVVDAKEKLLVRIAFARKDFSTVIQVGKSIAKRHGGVAQSPPEVAAMVALSLFEMGKDEAAITWAEPCFGNSDWQDSSLLVALSLKASRYKQKNRMYDQALQLLDQGIDKVHSEDLRNQLLYEKASLLLEQDRREEAEKVLTTLLQSSKELWKTAAKQKLDYLQLRPWNSWIPEKDTNAS
ncbi:tetratricopeptide repeat protein [Desulfosoma caldarium]|uniref:Tetratricopeptide repeat protein n=1 Tax=Desulfosoma caldarium TaxID=610254 RepID=A0A3N1VG67_9BACT|nr:tetratricopeptide repeat protein [Desulfosoma caldarium]ROR01865.1 tetratricopeptide repeat protein [Desulfosoma caldarium]